MRSKLSLTTARAATIFDEALGVRRELYSDSSFFKMTDVWAEICDDGGLWNIRTYRTEKLEDYQLRAGVVVFGDRLTLTTDERLFENARKGCKLSNYILAHELGHVILNHHATGAMVKNFQLFAGPNGMSNLPPTTEELEANFAAVCFQCGVSLMDQRWDATSLAHRSYSDVGYIRKAQRMVQLEAFQKELARLCPKKQRYPRVIL